MKKAIPDRVLAYAKEQGYATVKYVMDYKGRSYYGPIMADGYPPRIGLPTAIVFDGKKVEERTGTKDVWEVLNLAPDEDADIDELEETE